jgi:hypothetical protein
LWIIFPRQKISPRQHGSEWTFLILHDPNLIPTTEEFTLVDQTGLMFQKNSRPLAKVWSPGVVRSERNRRKSLSMMT